MRTHLYTGDDAQDAELVSSFEWGSCGISCWVSWHLYRCLYYPTTRSYDYPGDDPRRAEPEGFSVHDYPIHKMSVSHMEGVNSNNVYPRRTSATVYSVYEKKATSPSTGGEAVGRVIGIVVPIAFGLITSGLAVVSYRMTSRGTAASLGMAMVTFTAAAASGAAIGTGHIVEQGGRLVLQRARPGIYATLRTAETVARDVRVGSEALSGLAVDGATAVQSGIVNQIRNVAEASNSVLDHTLAARTSIANLASSSSGSNHTPVLLLGAGEIARLRANNVMAENVLGYREVEGYTELH